MGVLASKWGLGVSHSILGNDLHYEASEHFMSIGDGGDVLLDVQNET